MKPPTILLIFRRSNMTQWVSDQDNTQFHEWHYRKGQRVSVHMATSYVDGFMTGLTQVQAKHHPGRSATALIPTEDISIVRLMEPEVSTGKLP